MSIESQKLRSFLGGMWESRGSQYNWLCSPSPNKWIFEILIQEHLFWNFGVTGTQVTSEHFYRCPSAVPARDGQTWNKWALEDTGSDPQVAELYKDCILLSLSWKLHAPLIQETSHVAIPLSESKAAFLKLRPNLTAGFSGARAIKKTEVSVLTLL